MRKGVRGALTAAFFAAFLCILGAIWLRAAISGARESAALLPIIVLGAAALCAVYWALGRCEGFIERHFLAIAAGCALALLALNAANGFALRFAPIFDLGAMFSGASAWAETGGFMGLLDVTCDPDYFYYFPNNLGGMALLYLPIKLANILGISDAFAAAMLFNAVLVAATAFVAALACRRLMGARQGAMALACIMLMPPVYFMAPAFYTDSLSMLFPVLTLYLYLRLRDAQSQGARLALSALTGLAAAIGMLIKSTVLIALIAIVIGAALQEGAKKLLPRLALSAAVVAAVFMLFNGYIYANHLDRDRANELNTPYLHWVMMSLQGEGGYNPEDYEFTRSFSNAAQRDAAIRARIAERIRAKGFAGMLDHLTKKGAAQFGDGTLALSDFLDDGPQNETRLHSFLLSSGENYPAYRLCCTGMFLAIQLAMLTAAALALFRGAGRDRMIPLLSIFGLALFLMCWEVSPRYVTNYLPMMAICAAMGLSEALDGRQAEGR